MQPVQDLTVEDRVSRTQYQYSLEDADASELALWVPRFLARLQALPMLPRRCERSAEPGPETHLEIDRNASRLGITPQMLDDTLYDAFGERQISIMYTAAQSVHVVMERSRIPAESGGLEGHLSSGLPAAGRCR